MDEHLKELARNAIGFMPENEGLALYESARAVAGRGPLLEIGSYCGKSTIYLGAAAQERNSIVYSIDHHRGSEEHQPGGEYHDEDLMDTATGAIDTFPTFRRTIEAANLDAYVVPIVARSADAARGWATSLPFVFLDGGHSHDDAFADLEGWAPHVMTGGLLAIHDVFPDPKEGGRPPYEIYVAATGSGEFEEVRACGSLRVLERVRNDLGVAEPLG